MRTPPRDWTQIWSENRSSTTGFRVEAMPIRAHPSGSPMSFGVYIHFPYCRKRCPYCDFAIHVRRRIPHVEYADAVCRELSARAPLFEGRRLASVYFGGGTPSLWAAGEVARVLAAVRGAFGCDGEIGVGV